MSSLRVVPVISVALLEIALAGTAGAQSGTANPDSTGIITTVAGNGKAGYSGDGGTATTASLSFFLTHKLVDSNMNVYSNVRDSADVLARGVIADAYLRYAGIAVDREGNLYINDSANGRIRRVDSSQTIQTTARVRSGSLTGLAIDSQGNALFSNDNRDGVTYRIPPEGEKTAVAGVGFRGPTEDNIPAVEAYLTDPLDVKTDAHDNLYITTFSQILKVDTSTGLLTIVAGVPYLGFAGDHGSAFRAKLKFPRAVCVDSEGNLIFADSNNHRIRRIAALDHTITTLAGIGTAGLAGDGGPSSQATLNTPSGLALDKQGNLFVADTGNHRIRRIEAHTGIITTVAGTGIAGYAGDGGPAIQSLLSYPQDLVIDHRGTLFIADLGNHRVRMIRGIAAPTPLVAEALPVSQDSLVDHTAPRMVSSFPADGATNIDAAAFGQQHLRVTFDEPINVDGLELHIERNGVELKWSAWLTEERTLSIALFTSVPSASHLDPGFWYHITVSGVQDLAGNVAGDLALRFATFVPLLPDPLPGDKIEPTVTTVAGNGRKDNTPDGLQATQTSLPRPYDLCVDNEGTIYFTDLGERLIRRIDPSGYVSTVVRSPAQVYPTGGGLPSMVNLSVPISIFADREGGLYFPEWTRPLIYKVDQTGKVTGVVGQEKPWWAGSGSFGGDGGFASQAVLSSPGAVVADPEGNLFIADTYNHRVRRVDALTQIITTVVGSGRKGYCGDNGRATEACLNLPVDLWLDTRGDLYLSDLGNYRVRKVDSGGIITTVAGNGRQVYTGEGGPATQTGLIAPKGIFVDAAQQLFLIDGQVIRRVDPDGVITTVAGNGREGYAGDGDPPLHASFDDPRNLFGDARGDLYVADEGNHRIRKISGLATPTPLVAAPYPYQPPRDTTPPAIRATSPALAGLTTDPGTLDQLYVAFTEPVDPTLQVLLRRDNSTVGWTFWVAFDSLVIDRGKAPHLAPNTAYQLELAGVRDLYGNQAPDRVLPFTTGNTSADTTLPPSTDTIAVAPPDSLPPPAPDTLAAPLFSIALDFDLADGDQGQVLFDRAGADRIVDVQLYALDLPEITGWSAVLVFDPTQLRFLNGSFEPGAFLPGMVPLSDARAGQVEVGGAVLGAVTRRAGSGSLGVVSFEVLAGFGTEAVLTLTQIKLRQSSGQVASRWVQLPVRLASGAGSLLPPIVSVDFDLSPGNQAERLAAQAGPTYTFQLHIEGAPALTGWSALIEYDPLQVRYVGGSFQPGDFLPGLSPLVDDREGRLTLGGALLGARTGSGGGGQLGLLSFAAREGFLGSAVLKVAEFTLRLESGERYRGTLRTAATIHHAPANLVLDFDLAEGDQQHRSVKNALPGATYPVQLYLHRTLPIRGWGATLRYDAQKLRYLSGSFTPSSFVPGLVALVDEGEGQVILGGSTLGTDGSGEGDGPLGTLVFEVLPDFFGSAKVELVELSLRPLEGGIHRRSLGNLITFAGAPPPSLGFDFDLSAGDQEQLFLENVRPGGIYSVQLLVRDTPPINGWSAAIGFDPLELRYIPDSFRPGAFLPGLSALVSTKGDSVIVGGAVLGSDIQNSGSGVLGQLSFEVLPGFSGHTWLYIPGFSLRLPGGAVRRESATAEAHFLSGSGGATAVEDEAAILPTTTALLPGYPNPFNTTALLPYDLAEGGAVCLEIYNLGGQRVRTLVHAEQPPGYYQVTWPGTDDPGRPLASGVYLVRMQAGPTVQMQKLLLLR